MSSRLGQIAYGAFFAVAFPLLLYLWAMRLDQIVHLPAIGTRWEGVVIALIGAAVMTAAIVTLRIAGGGWPMSPYPPRRRVTAGLYAVVDDPIYTGAVLLAAGVAVALRSGAGIWIVTPLLAAACAAFVIGYERDATVRRFGPRAKQPFLRLPAASETAPVLADRLSVYLLVFLPWFLAYQAVNRFGTPRDARNAYVSWDGDRNFHFCSTIPSSHIDRVLRDSSSFHALEPIAISTPERGRQKKYSLALVMLSP